MPESPLQVDVRVHASASPEAVFAVLAHTEQWPSWAAFDEATLRSEGHPDRQGIGAVRDFRRGRKHSVERVVAFEPPHHFAYELVSGLPLRNYRADVRLAASADGGTDISWQSRFTARPGSTWIYRTALRTFIRRTAAQLATAAERG